MADVLEETATKVRMPDGPIHRVHRIEQSRDGRVYIARCNAVLSNVGGAILTTHNPTCPQCWSWSHEQ